VTTANDATEVPVPTEEGLLIDIDQLSVLLRRSVASLERDQAAGRLPAQVYVGGSRRWRRAEIVAWVAAGCPPRDQWEQTRTTGAP
jgi:predicted DNA-binding transcriptional regulator AlpA